MILPHLIQSRPMSRTICLKDRSRGICVSFDVEAALLTHPPFGVRIVQFRQSLLNTSPGVSWCGIYSTFCFYGRCIQAKEYRNYRRSPTNSSPLRKPDPSSRPRAQKEISSSLHYHPCHNHLVPLSSPTVELTLIIFLGLCPAGHHTELALQILRVRVGIVNLSQKVRVTVTPGGGALHRSDRSHRRARGYVKTLHPARPGRRADEEVCDGRLEVPILALRSTVMTMGDGSASCSPVPKLNRHVTSYTYEEKTFL